MSIKNEINRLSLAKSKISDAIVEKGVKVGSATKIDGFYSLIEKIPTGADNLCSVKINSNVGIKPIIFYSAFEQYRIVFKTAEYKQSEKTSILLKNVIGTAPLIIFYASPAFSFPTAYTSHKYGVKLKNISVSSGVKNYEWVTAAHLVVELNAPKGSVQNITLKYQ